MRLIHFNDRAINNQPELSVEATAAFMLCQQSRCVGVCQRQHHIPAMNLDLTDYEAAALTQELHKIVERYRYPFAPRIGTLRAFSAKLRPEPCASPCRRRRCMHRRRRADTSGAVRDD